MNNKPVKLPDLIIIIAHNFPVKIRGAFFPAGSCLAFFLSAIRRAFLPVGSHKVFLPSGSHRAFLPAKIRRAFLLLLAASLSAAVLSSCAPSSPSAATRNSFCLDTICTITIYEMDDMDTQKADAVIDEAFELCRKYESILSPHVPGSDTQKLNQAENHKAACHPETAELINKSLYYSDLSDGKFDITIGAVSSLWDFHNDSPSLPSREVLDTALGTVGYKGLLVSGNDICLTTPGARLDPGGIAKGYIADKACELLLSRNVRSAIVNLGGNVCVLGSKQGAPFSVGIETPYSDRSEVSAIAAASDETLVTCGIYERFFEKDGKKYHHVLSTENGYPVETDLLSVTVRSGIGHSADCDALSTICLIEGSDEALRLIESLDGFEAFMITADGRQLSTSGFRLK